MTDKKLSQLPAGSSLQATDLFYSAQDAGGGSFNSVYQTLSAVRGGIVGLVSIQVPTTGFSITIADNVGSLILNPAGILASGTVTMPATPIANRVDIRSTQPISSFTIAGNSGQTVKFSPGTLAAGQRFEGIYDSGSSTWYIAG